MPDTVSPAPASGKRPRFESLSRDESLRFLRQHSYGRMAFTRQGRVDIEPLHYVIEGDWLFVRTSPGTKLSTLRHGPWVAFEVDEVQGLFDWTSVVVKGTAYFVPSEQAEGDPRRYEHALAMLRRLIPEALTAEDPVPFRDVILRISINEITGRRATT